MRRGQEHWRRHRRLLYGSSCRVNTKGLITRFVNIQRGNRWRVGNRVQAGKAGALFPSVSFLPLSSLVSPRAQLFSRAAIALPPFLCSPPPCQKPKVRFLVRLLASPTTSLSCASTTTRPSSRSRSWTSRARPWREYTSWTATGVLNVLPCSRSVAY